MAYAIQGIDHHDEIDDHINAWTRDKSPQEVMRLLIELGVPADVVQRSSDLLQDPQLAHRRFFRYLEHPEMGNIPHTGHPFSIDGYDNGPRFPAPLLGQDSQLVLRDLLGMTKDEITEAVISGALA